MVRSAWEKLKLVAEAQDRDELLTKFDGRVNKQLATRVANVVSAQANVAV